MYLLKYALPLACVFFIIPRFSVLPSHAQPALGFVKPNVSEYQDIQSFPLYSEPGGEQAGAVQLIFHKATGSQYMQAVLLEKGDSLRLDINADMFHINRETSMMKFYSRQQDAAGQEGYARVLMHSTDKPLWLKLKQFKSVNWMDQLMQFSGYLVYGYENYRLRANPSTNAPILVKLSEKRHSIKSFTGRTSGSWAEIVVIEGTLQDGNELKECYNLNNIIVKREYTGWLKIVDDQGQYKDIKYSHSC